MEPDFNRKTIVIIGAGRTGMALARFFSTRGARVTVSDRAPLAALGNLRRELGRLGAALEAGGHGADTLAGADLVVLSPGVPHDLPVIDAARRRGVPVVGEVELASRFIHEPVVAVTGTNGKTTTVTLLGEMLKASGREVWVGGNIGRPLIEYVQRRETRELLVLELSSFQLDTIARFRPRVAVLLNVAADHLDRYDGLAAYAAAKARIFENQRADDTAVVNAADTRAMAAAAGARSRLLAYGHGTWAQLPGDQGALIEGRTLVIRTAETGGEVRLDLSSLGLRGAHNRENAAAAVLAALAAGAELDGIRRALAHFRGLPHRLQPVGTVDGVTYVNDSKATNVDAVLRALESFGRRVVLIMGGRYKGDDFGLLREPLARGARALIVMGEAADRILEKLDGVVETRRAADMRTAVAMARRLARPGDVVLLAPGCSSFDAYRDYGQRGEDFVQKVAELS